MYKRIEEPAVLFISILKWVFLATVIGVIIGFGTTAFLKTLKWGIVFTSNYSLYYFSLPAALFLSAAMVKYLPHDHDIESHGTGKVIEAVHKRAGKLKAAVLPVDLVATVITIVAGGSAGQEGPCAQIGAGLSSIFAGLFRFDDSDRRKLVICGISAGFAAAFGTPIAGAIYGVEVLFVGSILYDVLLPSFIAGIISYQVSSALGIHYSYHNIGFVHVFSNAFFLKVVLAGIFFGISSLILIEILEFGKGLSKRITVWLPLRSAVGGFVIVAFAFLFTSRYLGLGLESIEFYLKGGKAAWYDFGLKSIFTSITLNFGGNGGIITPIFFVGSSAGSLFAQLMREDITTFAAIGMVSLVAGASNTPIAASILAMEIFGPKLAPYAAISCVISFLMTGHRSVYTSQVLAFTKSLSIEVETGKDLENTKGEFSARGNWVTTAALNIARKMRLRRYKKK